MSTKELIARITSYKGGFDGYPSMTGHDEALIQHALSEGAYQDTIVMLSYLASEHARTPEQYKSAYYFITDYIQSVWACNMIEGDNPNFA
jgi:hypothetical protein